MTIFFQLDEEHYRLYGPKQGPEPIRSTYGNTKGKKSLEQTKDIFGHRTPYDTLSRRDQQCFELPACSSDPKHKHPKAKEGESRCL